MNASSALLFVVLLSSCISPLADSADGGDLPDAPADISVNSQFQTYQMKNIQCTYWIELYLKI